MDKTVFLLYTVGKAFIPKSYEKISGITFAGERGQRMKYAFVIDQRKCIGCHACTVACKAEHDVPIGVYRTWVKYVERGEFPHSRRYFLVNRCNHCDDAPCVTICPTRALYKREDGIVDFDSSRCIGCKSCMQACPYDAIYIDPNTHTAAKCNYCAHRTELGLEPACVIVCPERAIIAGDLHNPASEISRIVAREPVRVRKPEQGTGPNVYYLGADEATINPEAAAEELPHMTMWSTLLKPHHEDESAIDRGRTLRASVSYNNGIPVGQSAPSAYRSQSPGTNHGFSHEARIVYDTPKNRAPWGWRVSTYLGTKSIGAGVMIVSALILALRGWGSALSTPLNTLLGMGAPVTGGLFVAITLALLTADLKRPDRALYLVLKSNLTSWLVWGAYILGIFGLIELAWLLFALAGFTAGLYWLLVPSALFGAGAAGYTAFLFGQAEGRDFWQSPLLLPVLIVQAVLSGSAALVLLSWVVNESSTTTSMLTLILLVALALHALLVMVEVSGSHSNSHVSAAAHYMVKGPLQKIFWGGFFAVGTMIPLLILVIGLLTPIAQPVLPGIAGVLALAGLFAYEHCFVTAGQVVPLS